MQGSKQLRFTHLNLTLLKPCIHLHVAHTTFHQLHLEAMRLGPVKALY